MSDISIANKIGLMTNNLHHIENGIADSGTAFKLKIPQGDLQEFLTGKSTELIAEKFNLRKQDLQLLLDKLGSKGAVGLLIGFMLGAKS
jgi:hypothetical protein